MGKSNYMRIFKHAKMALALEDAQVAPAIEIVQKVAPTKVTKKHAASKIGKGVGEGPSKKSKSKKTTDASALADTPLALQAQTTSSLAPQTETTSSLALKETPLTHHLLSGGIL